MIRQHIISAGGIILGVLFFARPILLVAQTPDTTNTIPFVLTGGETLYSLAATFQLSADSLSKLNPDFADWLNEGDEIRIPSDRATRQIIVKPGETLFAIARRFDVTVDMIKSANNMTGSGLRSGQTLLIPGQGVSSGESIVASGRDSFSTQNLELIESGVAVVYPQTYIGRMTASGRLYRPDRFIISHPDLRIGSIVLVSSPGTGFETFAEIIDRGFKGDPQIIDVSEAVARYLRLARSEDKRIEIRAVRPGTVKN